MKEITHKDQILQSFVRTKLTLSLGKGYHPIISNALEIRQGQPGLIPKPTAKNTRQIFHKIERALNRVWPDSHGKIRRNPHPIWYLHEIT